MHSVLSSASIKGTLTAAIEVRLQTICAPEHSLIPIHFTYLSILLAETEYESFLQAKPELVPSLLTLALNDAMTYDKVC